jgi:hypothetical protein
MRTRPVQDAAGVVDAAGELDRVVVGEDVLTTRAAGRAAAHTRGAATEDL